MDEPDWTDFKAGIKQADEMREIVEWVALHDDILPAIEAPGGTDNIIEELRDQAVQACKLLGGAS
jgi:hypothetical protein